MITEPDEGIPTSGCRLAAALEQYAKPDVPFNILIVDNVLTTGASMEEHKASISSLIYQDYVTSWMIFAKSEPAGWIHTIFKLGHGHRISLSTLIRGIHWVHEDPNAFCYIELISRRGARYRYD